MDLNLGKSGDVGNLARNVIPTYATAVLDLRFVKGNDHIRQVAKLKRHIEKQGFYVTTADPTSEERLKHPLIVKFKHLSGSYNAQRTRRPRGWCFGPRLTKYKSLNTLRTRLSSANKSSAEVMVRGVRRVRPGCSQ